MVSVCHIGGCAFQGTVSYPRTHCAARHTTQESLLSTVLHLIIDIQRNCFQYLGEGQSSLQSKTCLSALTISSSPDTPKILWGRVYAPVVGFDLQPWKHKYLQSAEWNTNAILKNWLDLFTIIFFHINAVPHHYFTVIDFYLLLAQSKRDLESLCALGITEYLTCSWTNRIEMKKMLFLPRLAGPGL